MQSSRGRLRQLLKTTSPELHAALMRSWDIAEEEWLPALGAAFDSFNSYPHLRNVEQHLNALIALPVDTLSEEVRLRVTLTPAEIYILLAAALLHDIGRTQGNPHGYYSYNVIKKSYADLGIPSLELAKSVARVAAFHDRLETEYEIKKDLLFDRPIDRNVVDPYGAIHERLLAALLRLADCMDSALTRVMPLYLRPFEKIEVVGAFRSVITGVEVDHFANTVCTVLGEIPSARPETDDFHFVLHEDCQWNNMLPLQAKKEMKAHALERLLASQLRLTAGAEMDVLALTVLQVLCEKPHERGSFGYSEPGPATPQLSGAGTGMCSDRKARGVRLAKEFIDDAVFDAIEWLLARRAVMIHENRKKRRKQVEDRSSGGTSPKWHPKRILAIILGDVLKSARALCSVREELAAAGIPIRAWLIEGHEHLFNLWGEETFEPIFTAQYLRDVAKQMWHLDTGVFGQSAFTYQNLADSLRDPGTTRVKRAVRRLAIVMRGPQATVHQAEGVIGAGDEHWNWNCGKGGAGGVIDCDDAVMLNRVYEKIDELGSPV